MGKKKTADLSNSALLPKGKCARVCVPAFVFYLSV